MRAEGRREELLSLLYQDKLNAGARHNMYVLLCLVLFDLACFFLPSLSSLIKTCTCYTSVTCSVYTVYMYIRFTITDIFHFQKERKFYFILWHTCI